MRLIDAEPIEKYIENGLNEKDPEKRFGHDAIEIMTEIHYAPTIAPPPNDPLTLEELLGMDGEPVWVRNHCTGAYACRVIDSSDAHFTHFTDGGLQENRSYGSYWTAYRRRPEDGTT